MIHCPVYATYPLCTIMGSVNENTHTNENHSRIHYLSAICEVMGPNLVLIFKMIATLRKYYFIIVSIIVSVEFTEMVSHCMTNIVVASMSPPATLKYLHITNIGGFFPCFTLYSYHVCTVP